MNGPNEWDDPMLDDEHGIWYGHGETDGMFDALDAYGHMEFCVFYGSYDRDGGDDITICFDALAEPTEDEEYAVVWHVVVDNEHCVDEINGGTLSGKPETLYNDLKTLVRDTVEDYQWVAAPLDPADVELQIKDVEFRFNLRLMQMLGL